MGSVTPDIPRPELTPAQAADAIRGLYAIENKKALEGGWRRSQSALGKVALHTLRATGNIEVDDRLHLPLTAQEMGAGLKYMEEEQQPVEPPEAKREWPIEPNAEQLEQIEALVDKIPCSYTEAYAKVMGVWPN